MYLEALEPEVIEASNPGLLCDCDKPNCGAGFALRAAGVAPALGRPLRLDGVTRPLPKDSVVEGVILPENDGVTRPLREDATDGGL